MNEYINKKDFLKMLDESFSAALVDISDVFEIADDVPDTIEIVRCKDCLHWHKETGWCDIHSHFIDTDGEACHPWESHEWEMFGEKYFCKDGKRKHHICPCCDTEIPEDTQVCPNCLCAIKEVDAND